MYRKLSLAVVALVAACSAQDASKPDSKAMVTQNPDGTITAQKQPKKDAKRAKARPGLVIPPQVVIPIAAPPATHKRQNDRQ